VEPKAKVVSLIELTFERGEGRQLRQVTQYRTGRGRLLWEHDPLHARAINDAITISEEASNGNGTESGAA